jgi:DNA-binding transcriptional ArsR family regulator
MKSVKSGPKIKQRELETLIKKLLQKNPDGLHFSKIQELSRVKSPNRISAALKALRSRGAVKVNRQPGPGIPRSIYSLTNPAVTSFELERDEILQRILEAPLDAAKDLRTLKKQVDSQGVHIEMLEQLVRDLVAKLGLK